MLSRLTRKLLLCLVAPVCANYIAYYGFVTHYSVGVFTPRGFHAQYDHEVFRYRLLGKWLLLGVYGVLERLNPADAGWGRLAAFVGTDSVNFYHSYFVLNTAFLCLTLLVVADRLKDVELLVVTLVVSVTQFVVVPYDVVAYFFLACTFVWRRSLAVTALVVLLAALNRETAALSLSLYASLLLLGRGGSWRGLGVLTAVFLATYVGLRVALGWNTAVGNELTLVKYMDLRSAVGVGFAVAAGYALVSRRRAAALFLLCSLPYVLSILITGNPFEARLWAPLLLGILFVQSADAEGDPDPPPATPAARDAAAPAPAS
ncbi:MAG TPA: hypothetical protein VF668_08775 [Pyrinomonadaceae bacterium]|jgi:hypothetical protein